MSDYGKKLYNFSERAWTKKKALVDIDYWGVDWSGQWLGENSIVTATYEAPAESGLILSNDHIKDGYITNQMFSGGLVGDWPINIIVTTSDGRVRQETFILRVE